MIKAIIPARRATDKSLSDAVVLPPRGYDEVGGGHFGAKRGDRKHVGIDYACTAGAKVLCPVDGKVTKLGYPYGDDLSYRYVQITDSNDLDHRLFYVEPSCGVGDDLKVGDIIGESQDIAGRYKPKDMKNHVHYEIRTPAKRYLNPDL